MPLDMGGDRSASCAFVQVPAGGERFDGRFRFDGAGDMKTSAEFSHLLERDLLTRWAASGR